MPFKSDKQKRYLWAKEPEVTRKWTKKYGAKIVAAVIKSKRKKK